MRVNFAPYIEDASQSVINTVGTEEAMVEYRLLNEKYWYLMHSTGLTSLQFFKKVFGRQKITKNYTERNWVWTFTDDDGSTLYCLVSKGGPSWEYDVLSKSNPVKILKEVVEYMANEIIE